MPKLLVVIASTRPGRIGLPVAQWFTAVAEAHAGFEVEVADLAELALPMMDEPNHPRLQQYEHQHTRDWSAMVDAADAFVFVTPEYNHTFTAPLKNALDYLHNEWAHKPVALVSYGGVAAGTRAVQALKPALVALRLLPIVEAVTIPFVASFMDDDGVFQPNEIATQSATLVLDELVAASAALRTRRAAV